jgi:hypothetical protein
MSFSIHSPTPLTGSVLGGASESYSVVVVVDELVVVV